jgi:hypothetical protein
MTIDAAQRSATRGGILASSGANGETRENPRVGLRYRINYGKFKQTYE